MSYGGSNACLDIGELKSMVSLKRNETGFRMIAL